MDKNITKEALMPDIAISDDDIYAAMKDITGYQRRRENDRDCIEG